MSTSERSQTSTGITVAAAQAEVRAVYRLTGAILIGFGAFFGMTRSGRSTSR